MNNALRAMKQHATSLGLHEVSMDILELAVVGLIQNRSQNNSQLSGSSFFDAWLRKTSRKIKSAAFCGGADFSDGKYQSFVDQLVERLWQKEIWITSAGGPGVAMDYASQVMKATAAAGGYPAHGLIQVLVDYDGEYAFRTSHLADDEFLVYPQIRATVHVQQLLSLSDAAVVFPGGAGTEREKWTVLEALGMKCSKGCSSIPCLPLVILSDAAHPVEERLIETVNRFSSESTCVCSEIPAKEMVSFVDIDEQGAAARVIDFLTSKVK